MLWQEDKWSFLLPFWWQNKICSFKSNFLKYFFLKKKKVPIYLKERGTDGNLLSCGSLSRWPQHSCPSQTEAGNQELLSDPPMHIKGPRTWANLCCLLMHSTGSFTSRGVTKTDIGCQHSKWQPKLLYHNSNPLSYFCYIYWFIWKAQQERERAFITWFILQIAARLGLGQAEGRIEKLHLGIQC